MAEKLVYFIVLVFSIDGFCELKVNQKITFPEDKYEVLHSDTRNADRQFKSGEKCWLMGGAKLNILKINGDRILTEYVDSNKVGGDLCPNGAKLEFSKTDIVSFDAKYEFLKEEKYWHGEVVEIGEGETDDKVGSLKKDSFISLKSRRAVKLGEKLNRDGLNLPFDFACQIVPSTKLQILGFAKHNSYTLLKVQSTTQEPNQCPKNSLIFISVKDLTSNSKPL